MNTVVGFDGGYSRAKIVHGKPDSEPSMLVLPTGAAPLRQAMRTLSGEVARNLGRIVVVKDEEYLAAVEHDDLQQALRPMHDRYPCSSEFQANYRAALASLGADEIELVVVGLPVYQALNKEFREGFAADLAGTLDIGGGRTIKVGAVKVVPQPAGGALDFFSRNPDQAASTDLNLLVVDVGSYTVDWVVFRSGRLRDKSAGSSKFAVLHMLEQTMAALQDGGQRVSLQRLERALRNGSRDAMCGAQSFPFGRELEAVARQCSMSIVGSIQAKARADQITIDHVLLCGGGASLVSEAVRDAFSQAEFEVAPEPAMANARGFYQLARNLVAAPNAG